MYQDVVDQKRHCGHPGMGVGSVRMVDTG